MYISLGWHLCSLRYCITSVQDLLAFIVSADKSGVILIGLHLYVTCVFSLSAFNILSLFSAFVVLIIICQEEFLFWSIYLEFCRLLVYSWESLSLGIGSFLL